MQTLTYTQTVLVLPLLVVHGHFLKIKGRESSKDVFLMHSHRANPFVCTNPSGKNALFSVPLLYMFALNLVALVVLPFLITSCFAWKSSLEKFLIFAIKSSILQREVQRCGSLFIMCLFCFFLFFFLASIAGSWTFELQLVLMLAPPSWGRGTVCLKCCLDTVLTWARTHARTRSMQFNQHEERLISLVIWAGNTRISAILTMKMIKIYTNTPKSHWKNR